MDYWYLPHCMGCTGYYKQKVEYSVGTIDYQEEGGKFLMPAVTLPALGLWMGIASLIFGVIVMIFPKILNYLVGVYLIIIGVMALIAYFSG